MSQFISLQEAIDMTSLYRNQREDILKPAYQNQGILALSETFERSVIDTLLSQEGCTRLRIYYGMSEDFKIHAIIAGVDAANNDLLPAQSSVVTPQSDDESIAEKGIRCPDICPPDSPLNS